MGHLIGKLVQYIRRYSVQLMTNQQIKIMIDGGIDSGVNAVFYASPLG